MEWKGQKSARSWTPWVPASSGGVGDRFGKSQRRSTGSALVQQDRMGLCWGYLYEPPRAQQGRDSPGPYRRWSVACYIVERVSVGELGQS
jgi:hypothetical protein